MTWNAVAKAPGNVAGFEGVPANYVLGKNLKRRLEALDTQQPTKAVNL